MQLPPILMPFKETSLCFFQHQLFVCLSAHSTPQLLPCALWSEKCRLIRGQLNLLFCGRAHLYGTAHHFHPLRLSSRPVYRSSSGVKESKSRPGLLDTNQSRHTGFFQVCRFLYCQLEWTDRRGDLPAADSSPPGHQFLYLPDHELCHRRL